MNNKPSLEDIETILNVMENNRTIKFLEALSVETLEQLLIKNSQCNEEIIKILFKKKILNNE